MTDIAWPKAGTALTQELLDLIQQTQHARQIRKGANEVTKALNRGVAELLVLAADAEPLAVSFSSMIERYFLADNPRSSFIYHHSAKTKTFPTCTFHQKSVLVAPVGCPGKS